MHRVLAVLFSTFLALAAPAHAVAAEGVGSITGRVLNPATGEYVANAEVRVAEIGRAHV